MANLTFELGIDDDVLASLAGSMSAHGTNGKLADVVAVDSSGGRIAGTAVASVTLSATEQGIALRLPAGVGINVRVDLVEL